MRGRQTDVLVERRAAMTRGDFDPDVDWNDQDSSPDEPDEGFELLPPNFLEGQIQNASDAEKDLIDPYPGEKQSSKSTDPDEWHH
jgi:hypothetical protein